MNTTPICVLLLTFLLSACNPFQSDVQYSLLNSTGETVTDANVSIGKHSFNCGIIPPGAHKSFSGILSISGQDMAKISWRTDDQQKHLRSLIITKAELTDERQVQFVINPDGSVTRQWRFAQSP